MLLNRTHQPEGKQQHRTDKLKDQLQCKPDNFKRQQQQPKQGEKNDHE